MKKTLITMTAILVASTGMAQDIDMKSLSKQKASLSQSAVATKKVERSMGEINKAKSRRAQKDGVWYARPQGSFLFTGGSASSSYEYIAVPPFTEFTFKNMCTDKAQSKWLFGETEITKGIDEEGNLTFSYDKSDYGYVSLLPTISVEGTTYTAGKYAFTIDSVQYSFQPFNYLKGKRYYGYQDGSSPFMSGDDSFDFNDDTQPEKFHPWGFRQFFDKPINPLVLDEISMWMTTNDSLFNGEPLKAVITKVARNADGRRIPGEVIDTLDFAGAEISNEYLSETVKVYPGDIYFSKFSFDEFGTPTTTPIIIDDEFAITIIGVDAPGLDIRFYFTDQGESDEEFYSWAKPTFILCADDNGNHIDMANGNGLSYYGSSSNGNYCYSMVIYFTGRMDAIEVSAMTAEQIAADEGGESGAPIEDGKGQVQSVPAYVYTNYPIYDTSDPENPEYTGIYGFEGIPEWAKLRIDPTYYEYGRGTENEMRGLNQIWFNVEALPEGVTGRSAIIIVKSAFGVVCDQHIHLIQGDAEVVDGVKALRFDNKGRFVESYNMNGQRVNDNQKGLVIRNGKKMIKK